MERKDPTTASQATIQFYTYVFFQNCGTNRKYRNCPATQRDSCHFSTYYAHIVRELIAQEYVVVSAEYRGSTGYGKTTYENIDYGGRENDDVLESRNYMIDNYSFVDSTRVGIIGWSHGGMIALMQILQHGDNYQCAFAGVPVSDLENRLARHEEVTRITSRHLTYRESIRKIPRICKALPHLTRQEPEQTVVNLHQHQRQRRLCGRVKLMTNLKKRVNV